MSKPRSRPVRWCDAVSAAKAAIAELREVQDEYQDWYDNLPDNLFESKLAAKLEEVTDIDIYTIECTLDEAEEMDLPLGFGRD